jgi:glycosyltransferase involved in cell wall biosynthesis
MKIAIITSRYPTKNNPYNHMFVHARSLYFIKQQNLELTVFVPSKNDEAYIFEKVNVIKTSSQNIAKDILNFDVIYLHLLNIYPNQKLSGWNIYKSIIDNNIPCVMYIHGSEAQKYGTRNFDYDFSIQETLKFLYKDFYFIPKIKRFVKAINKRTNSIFLAPSTWMIKEAEKNLSLKFNNFEVIPNGIDTKLFKFYDLYANRYKLITLRPLENIYAIDIAIEVMKYLPKQYILDIYGKGRFQRKYQDLINKYNLDNRIKIVNRFIDRKDLNSFYSNYGCMLSLSRSDTQGVTRCEAMSSGLLTVSSNITAIPEFISDMKNGILGDNNNPKSIAKKIIDVVENKAKYKKICRSARESMEAIDIDKTMRRELDVFKMLL